MDSDSTAHAPSPPFCAVINEHEGSPTIRRAVWERGAPQTIANLGDGLHAPLGGAAQLAPMSRAEGIRSGPTRSSKGVRKGGRRLRVLVVDDEPIMCELVHHILDQHYEVRTFSDGRAALACLREGTEFDVVLSDLMMPDVSGMDLFGVLTREQPQLARRMIFMTGGTFTERMDRFLADTGACPLMKPFGREDLLERIAAQLQLQ